MHGMKMGGHPMGYGGGMHDMGVPLVPAPMAFMAMLFGIMIGVMIGKKKSMMHGMGSGMMHGMGPDMACGPKSGMGMMGMGSGMGSGMGWDDWAMRKKMMKKMWAHHHHGEGAPACKCDEGQAAMSMPEEGMSDE
jgi:hypothetical protein